MSVLDRVQMFEALTSLCVQATIHCKDQAKWTWCVFCFLLFFSFLDLLYLQQGSVSYEATNC